MFDPGPLLRSRKHWAAVMQLPARSRASAWPEVSAPFPTAGILPWDHPVTGELPRRWEMWTGADWR